MTPTPHARPYLTVSVLNTEDVVTVILAILFIVWQRRLLFSRN